MALARKPFVVLDAEILSSSVWSEAASVRLVWITLLILCDTEGYVGASVPGIASAAGVGLQDAEDALQRLQQPDPYSRTKTNEGRRLAVTERGWQVLNFIEHLDRLSSERTKARDRMRRHRERKAKPKRKRNRGVTNMDGYVTIHAGNRDQGVGNKEKGIDGERAPVTDSAPSETANGNGVPEGQRTAYADEVWSEFMTVSEQRGTRLMTPGEFEVLKRWMDMGVPLHAVCRAIRETKGKGRMLAYYNSSVLEVVEKHRQAVPL